MEKELKNCVICGKERKENIIIRDINVKEPLEVCGDCLNDYANGDFDILTKKLEKKNEN